MSAWRAALNTELAKISGDFVAYVRERGENEPSKWNAADAPLLAGLEAWATELATRDPIAGIAALATAAETGFALAMMAAGSEADNMGFHANEPHSDGMPVGTQIARALAFLNEPSSATLKDVQSGFDPTRQLYVWGEDLIPGTETQPFFWYSEVGQCLACAIMKGDATTPTQDIDSNGDPTGDGEPPAVEFDPEDREAGYENWPAAVCVARGLVMACRGLREVDSVDDAPGLARLRAAMS